MLVDEAVRKKHLGGADNGIDAMSIGNEISYQMKCYTETTVTWRSISTFIGLSLLMNAIPCIVCLPETKIAKKLHGEILNGYIRIERVSYEQACNKLRDFGITDLPPMPDKKKAGHCCTML
jgi:hypothetical protein